VNKTFTEEKTNEFLKLIKYSDYSFVKQFNKTPIRISMLSLLLSFKPLRKALQKVLNEAYVPQDINQKIMKHLVRRIQALNYLYFTKNELDFDGTRNNRPKYIIMQCKDVLIEKVLIDNGLTLNMLLRHMLREMLVDESHIRPYTIMARTYDGSPRQIIKTLEMELYVGSQVFLVTLQVMDIHPFYNILLGRS